MARVFCKVLGIATLLMGVVGFVDQHFMGLHLTPVHNLVHLATGVVALWVGFAGTWVACRSSSRIFGVVYGFFSLLGFVAPGLLGAILGHPGLSAGELMPDNVLHVAITVASLAAGFVPSPEAGLRTAS